MNKFLNIVKNLFLGMKPGFILKSYIFAGIIFYFTVIKANQPFLMSVYLFLCLLVFPFANLIWNDLAITLFGNTFLIMNPILMFSFKLIKYLFLYAFALFIAPLGIIYIIFNQKILSKYHN